MKAKISVSVDKATVAMMDLKVEEGLYRNKSHIVEYAVKKLLKDGGQNE